MQTPEHCDPGRNEVAVINRIKDFPKAPGRDVMFTGLVFIFLLILLNLPDSSYFARENTEFEGLKQRK